jgi:hypothetical protein
MGDEAENIYEQVRPLGNTIRFGIRRPKGIKVGSLPEVTRHMPDFFTTTYLVEVCGLGRDNILKSVKVSKYNALKVWHKIAQLMGLMGVVLFIWNSSKQQFIVVAWTDVVSEVAYSKKKYGIQKFDSDGVEYYRLDWDRLCDKASFIGAYNKGES